MKIVGGRKQRARQPAAVSTAHLAITVPTYTVTYHTGSSAPETEERYAASPSGSQNAAVPLNVPPVDHAISVEIALDEPLPLLMDAGEESAGAIPAYDTTTPCDEEGERKKRQNVAHMEELKAQEAVFLRILLSVHYSSQLMTPCGCSTHKHVCFRGAACSDCLQAELLCRQCWLNKHRTIPTHWALVWNKKERFFEKHDFSRVMDNTTIGLGHYGLRCPDADLGNSFTLVDRNGIHATAVSFCRCKAPDGQRGVPKFQQLLQAGIFPGSVTDPKTGYTLGLLDYYREMCSQGKGSAYNFVLVLQRLADPFFADSVPDIYKNFLAITRFHQELDIIMRRGHAHGVEDPLPGKADRPYPNRPRGYLGLLCAACPERGVNMPLAVNVPRYLRHLISQFLTLDGNFKANLFYKRDDGSDKALTDGRMYFPAQNEYDRIAKEYVVQDEDKEVPCKAHIGSIWHQGSVKYGNTAVSGVVACVCDHAVVGSFVDMLKGEAYDSWCSFCVNLVQRAVTLFPEETWLHTLLVSVEGQIPADHINGHGLNCQTIWQAVYFACRAHFHGETAEVLRQAQLLADERLDSLRLFKLHMAVVEDLSRQHTTEVADWSRLSRLTTKSAGGKPRSVYQHESTRVLTVENVLAAMLAEEHEKSTHENGQVPKTRVAKWIHDGMRLERQQYFLIALLQNHREHPLEETWATITKLRDSLNLDLKKFRETQLGIYPRLKLSALDADEPELTAIQLPSYHMKHGQRAATGLDANDEDSRLREAEITLRCSEATSGILAVRAASLALSAIKKARDLDYRGQVGISRSQRNLQKAEMMKMFEICMYNRARTALVHLGHMEKEAHEPYPPLSHRDTRRKETHLHRAKGDSRLFDGTAWGRRGAEAPGGYSDAEALRSPRATKRLKDIAPEDVEMQSSSSSEAEDSNSDVGMSPSAKRKQKQAMKVRGKKKPRKSDGWIWLESLTSGQNLGNDKIAEYKRESDRVQWFRAEAEMYRWLERYERKYAELMRVIKRYRRDGEVWARIGDREEERNGGVNGAATFARMQAAMFKRLEHNANVIFKSAESGAHHDWASAATFDELVIKIDGWRDVVFKWMDDMGIHRAYKDF
ncbi:hypothetical protein DFH09DRAFT_1086573 [Mycena vulgaris]|nr:hypothetical protein DFH09DRAFT_1086573 [Mycena vulgaris]